MLGSRRGASQLEYCPPTAAAVSPVMPSSASATCDGRRVQHGHVLSPDEAISPLKNSHLYPSFRGTAGPCRALVARAARQGVRPRVR
eukprot:5643408-Pyramimonas_sp.AAC.1